MVSKQHIFSVRCVRSAPCINCQAILIGSRFDGFGFQGFAACILLVYAEQELKSTVAVSVMVFWQPFDSP